MIEKRNPMKRLFVPLLALSALSPLALHADEAAIRQALTQRYAKMPIKSVTATAIPGIYEVFTGGQVVYADENGEHLLVGSLVETRTRTNLTQQRMESLSAVKFDSLPFEKAITLVKGKGERKIAVFSDPDCPYCKKLEKELTNLDNLTVYLFLMPLAELHPQAVGLAKDIWCAEDRAKAWSGYMLDGKKPESGKTCDNPVDAIAKLAGELGINGTPAIILSNGRRLEGAVPAAKLEAMLSGS
jgi:thiol:disulfide interchange protein DsbC